MNKHLILAVVFLLSAAFLFSACVAFPGPDDDPPLIRTEKTDQGPFVPTVPSSDAAVPDFSSILSGNGSTDTVWGSQDPAARQMIIDAAKEAGYDVSFADDGSMTVKGQDGTVFVQNPDGTWTAQGEQGQSTQIGGDWPDNEYTKLVPKPDFKLFGASASEDGFSAAFQSVDADQVKAYAEKVKANGFTVDASEDDQVVYGITVYMYRAYNAEGYYVEISFTSGTGGITISK